MATYDARRLVGETIDGRYLIKSHLADGGMGSVYVALDQRLDREVALKIMRDDLSGDQEFVDRFRREARSAASLSHPNVVGVYDQGEDRGLVFLAMELISGTTLRAWLTDAGALTPREALHVTEAILKALSRAHHAGIIHRDIKPENVLIAEDGRTVKVADFGLARAVSTRTATGATMLGTVSYLAPEQVERGIADARSDVYAVGLLLFEMLTGRKAVDGDTPIQVAYQHVHGEIPVPSEQIADLPPELDALVAWATARDPDDRPADASALLTQLRGSRSALTPLQLDARPLVARSTSGAAQTSRLGAPTTAIPLTQNGPAPTSAPRAAATAPAATGPEAPGRVVTTRPRRGVRIFLAAVLVALLGAAGGGWYQLLGPGAVRHVPVLAGLTRTAALSALSARDLGAQITDSFSESVAKDVVISAEPKADAELRRGQLVAIVVSKGKERYTVPELTGRSVDAATATLTASNLKVAGVAEEFSETVAVGEVLGSDPKAGTSVKRDAAVTLRVSKGREPFTVTSQVGQPLATAKAAWEKFGLTVVVGTAQFSTTVPKDAIISQNPMTGTLYKGDTITVVPSKGPDTVEVPNVRGKSENTARAILENAGFRVSVRYKSGSFLGLVFSMDPGSGTKAPRGSTVTIWMV